VRIEPNEGSVHPTEESNRIQNSAAGAMQKIFKSERWIRPLKDVGFRIPLRWLGLAFSVATFSVASFMMTARAETPQTFSSPNQLVDAMVVQEKDSASKHERYEYLSTETSDRTGGHMWTERVVETGQGKIRFLLAVDGQPLNAAQQQAERDRLKTILADPRAFETTEAARMGDESKSRQMLDNLNKGFVLDHVELINGVWHVNFHPNPDYSPSGLQERVLHGMSGWLAIDAKDLRLVHIEASLPSDVSIGFGFLATIRAGSHFESDRQFSDGHWRTTHLVTDIRGKAILFKSVAKTSVLTCSDFHYLDPNITLAQAVELVEKP
jgi:hypothetical protein